jgi:hypothetical protein
VPRSCRLTMLLVLVVSACNGTDDAEPEACRPEDREVLVAEQLVPDIPSMPFEVAAGDDVWVGPIQTSRRLRCCPGRAASS